MPPEPVKKTASAPRRRIALVVTIALIGFGLLCLWAYFRVQGDRSFGKRRVHYTWLTTPTAREKGLSGRASLPENEAMLFAFEKPGRYCFWMKDMRFPIDMLWLDQDRKVVTIKSNVQPSSYPESFCPTKPATYVIEVNAGLSQQAQVTVGQQLQF